MYTHYAEHYDTSQMRFSILIHGYLNELLQRHGGPQPAGSAATAEPAPRMLDLACGTGTLALLMAEEGWDVLGIDASRAMLQVAQRKARRLRGPGQVRFRRGDMRRFSVEQPVALITSFYDSLNYLLDERELLAVFQHVRQALEPGGLWIFDMNTPYFLQHVWSAVEAEEYEGYLQVMQSHFDAERCISTLVLTGFVRHEDQLYNRFDEVHVERGYQEETINGLLQQAGLQIAGAYDAFTTGPAVEKSHRLVWVARRPAAE